MRTVRGDIQKVNQDTADGMKNLIELDLVKNRIQLASKALQEADNWETLSAQIDDVFETKDTVQVDNYSIHILKRKKGKLIVFSLFRLQQNLLQCNNH